ncbi:MAG: zinc metallopeptidase [Puniceicoccales bacterium]|jgi:Zn-dependent membrane protease YugP|nr:zinc metallopeptidase [Puniceicoccales bacterium]
MKPAIVILAVFVAAFAIPWLAAKTVRRAWLEGRTRSASGRSGATFAALILIKSGLRSVNIVENGRLFHERFDVTTREVALSREVHDGHSLSALAHAALQAGHAIQHAECARPYTRLVYWNHTLRLIVNALPVLLVLMALHPGAWRAIPLLGLFFLLLAGIQVLTFPAVRAAADNARKVVLEHRLLPPEEMDGFQKALKSATERHLAAPLFECFFLRWLF